MDKRLVQKIFATKISGTSARLFWKKENEPARGRDFPNIKNVYKKSDNAECYAGKGYILENIII